MPIFKTKNENFFKKWSPEMAYVLGFFVADGCMLKNKRGAYFIEFQITDKDLLLKIRKLLNSNLKVTERRSTNSTWKRRYRLQIGSKEIFHDLSELGMTPKKSKSVRLPKVPNKYFCHFVRGYFDGDGNVYANPYKRKDRGGKMCVTLLSGFTCGSRMFLDGLHQKLKRFARIEGGTLYIRSGAYRLYFSVRDSRKLYHFMYNENNGIYLKRKKDVFENYFLGR